MTSRVILQPAGDSDAMGHFVDTIEIPVDVSRVKPFLSTAQIEELGDIFEGRTSIPIWGVTSGNGGGNAKKWDRIESGDVTLFSRKGRIFASATVVAKIHNKSLALDLWSTNSDGETWEYVYFLDELTEQNIPYSAFNEAVGYKPNFVIQGFSILDETKSNLLFNAFDLRSAVYFPDIPVQDYYTAVASLDDASSLDSVVMGKGRVEQQFLRKILLGKRSVAECCLCGRMLPVSLLWAAHIKKRSACSLEEKKDFKHIVAPMCKLGCDELFERGYISVDGEGYVVVTKSYLLNDLETHLSIFSGKKCLIWNEQNKHYFAWHFKKNCDANSVLNVLTNLIFTESLNSGRPSQHYSNVPSDERFSQYLTLPRPSSSLRGSSTKFSNFNIEKLITLSDHLDSLVTVNTPISLIIKGIKLVSEILKLRSEALSKDATKVAYALALEGVGKQVNITQLRIKTDLLLQKYKQPIMNSVAFNFAIKELEDLKSISINGQQVKLIEPVRLASNG